MENSHIEWTTHTFNPWHGCAKVSPGCKNCYAEGQHNFHYSSLKAQQGTCWGVGSPRLATSADNWKKPLKWNREAQAAGIRPRVFCASMADVFEEQSATSKLFASETAQVPSGPGRTRTVRFVDIAAERLKLLRLIYDTPHLDWLLLTKRPENIGPAIREAYQRSMPGNSESSGLLYFSHWLGQWAEGKAPANVWLGTSVENQEQADARIPHLLAAPAAVRFLSCEPLLGPVDLVKWMPAGKVRARCSRCGYYTNEAPGCKGYCEGKPCDGLVCPGCGKKHGWSGSHYGNGRPNGQPIGWVIVGGESGPKARPMHPKWAESLRDQCQAAGVAFHFKQWGEWQVCNTENGYGYGGTMPDDKAYRWVHADGLVNGPSAHRVDGPALDAYAMHRAGKGKTGRLLDGRTWDELPTGATSAPAPAKMKVTPYRELKDKYVGAPGTPERAQFDQELADELAGLKQ